MSNQEIKFNAVFVDYRAGKNSTTGKEYYVVTLSNGLRSGSAFLSKACPELSNLSEGDDVEVTARVNIGYKGTFVVEIVDVVPA